ncbi:MAG: nucleotide pyrophosphohydrolase [Myxococcales bacterium]|nr:nucleotide pyrophosphohydrolase [Myxococcales bacterium]
MLARLTEETGEVAREYNHRFGSKQKKGSEGGADLGTPAAKEEVASELGDVLFILLCMANQQGIDMDEAFAGVMEKLKVRDAGRFSG